MGQAQRVLVMLNTISTVAMLVVNGFAASGRLGGVTVKEISDRYETLFTPAGYAFSIWSVIFLFLAKFTLIINRSRVRIKPLSFAYLFFT